MTFETLPGRPVPPPRPPLRVDARRVPGLGRAASPSRFGYARALPAGRARGRRASARRRRWRCSPAMNDHASPSCRLVVLIGPVRLRQVHVRAQALQADRGALVRLLPRAGLATTRTTRRRPTTRSRCCTSSPRKRLARGRLTVVDATNVQPEARKPLVALARAVPRACRSRSCSTCPSGSARSATAAGPTATSARTSSATRRSQLRRSLRGLEREGFRHVFVLSLAEEVEAADDRARSRSGTTGKHEHGPFDIIGDVHGCCDELRSAAASSSATR